jgi:hypothetical protein
MLKTARSAPLPGTRALQLPTMASTQMSSRSCKWASPGLVLSMNKHDSAHDRPRLVPGTCRSSRAGSGRAGWRPERRRRATSARSATTALCGGGEISNLRGLRLYDVHSTTREHIASLFRPAFQQRFGTGEARRNPNGNARVPRPGPGRTDAGTRPPTPAGALKAALECRGHPGHARSTRD